MAGNAREANTVGKYTVVRKLSSSNAPGRVYAARSEDGTPAVLMLPTHAAEWRPGSPCALHVETSQEPPFLALRITGAVGHRPASRAADVLDAAAAALEGIEHLPEAHRHLRGARVRSPPPARVRTQFWGGLGGALAAAALAWVVLPTQGERGPVQPVEGERVGVAEEALVEPVALPVATMDARRTSVALDMPSKPFPGQYRVDKEGKCKARAERPINGGCWIALRDLPPPCENDAYEWRGGCYLPSMPSAKEPSSTAPRTPLGPAQRAK